MTQQRLGRPTEAQKTVEQALQAIAKWKPKGKPNLLLDWRQRLGLRQLQSEATATLKHVADTTVVDERLPSFGNDRPIDKD